MALRFTHLPAKVYLAGLNPLHNSAIRHCIVGLKSSPVVSSYAESNETPVKHHLAQLLLQYSVRLQRLPGSLAHSVVYNPIVREPYQNREHLQTPFGIRALRIVEAYDLRNMIAMSCATPDFPI